MIYRVTMEESFNKLKIPPQSRNKSTQNLNKIPLTRNGIKYRINMSRKLQYREIKGTKMHF